GTNRPVRDGGTPGLSGGGLLRSVAGVVAHAANGAEPRDRSGAARTYYRPAGRLQNRAAAGPRCGGKPGKGPYPKGQRGGHGFRSWPGVTRSRNVLSRPGRLPIHGNAITTRPRGAQTVGDLSGWFQTD